MKAKSHTLHANMMLIDNTGVLIRGKAKTGKSELCLALIDRGHQLVSDDAVTVYLENNRLMGIAPAQIQGQLQTDTLGLIELATLYKGATASGAHPIDLCLEVCESAVTNSQPLSPPKTSTQLFGCSVITYQIPLHPRALIVELLVKTFRQRNSLCKANV